MWGTWMTVLLVGVGIVLSIRFAFRYQRKILFNFKNTYGKIGAKGEGEGTISGFRAACTALANTVGTGNISGALTTVAFTNAYEAVGGKLTAIAIAVFAWTTIIGMYYTCEKSVNYAFGDTEKNAAPESGIIGKNDLRRIRQALPGAGGSHAAKTICTRNIYKAVPPRMLSRELRFHTCRPTTQAPASSSGRNEAGPAKVMSFRQ